MMTCQVPLNLLIQYILVALIIAGAVSWIIWKIIKSKKKGNVGCCGCSLADTCRKAKADAGNESLNKGNSDCAICSEKRPCCHSNHKK